MDAYSGSPAVAWADTRHGAAEIYLRTWNGSWAPESRVTDLPGECRHPSLKAEFCCGDAIQTHLILTYEHTAPGGVTETWTDVQATNHRGMQEGSSCPWITNPIEPLSEIGLSHATVAAAAGNPDAHLIILWIEEVAGVPTLLARRGAVPGCAGPDPRAPASLLLTPGGTPVDTLVMLDECSHEPLANQTFRIEFSPALDQDLTWDPLQQHPAVSATTNALGQAIFSLRGGGCSQAGTATADFDDYGMPVAFKTWVGAKSPDLDGDCVVRDLDIAAVHAALGTADFCADLDGNGVVDEADAAIVESALGEHCSHINGIESAPPAAGHRPASGHPSQSMPRMGHAQFARPVLTGANPDL